MSTNNINKEKNSQSKDIFKKTTNIDDFIEQEISARRKANGNELGVSPFPIRSTQNDGGSKISSISTAVDDPLQSESSTNTKKKSFLSKAFGKIKDKMIKKNDIGKASIIVHNSNASEEFEKIAEVQEEIIDHRQPATFTINQSSNIEDEAKKKQQAHNRHNSQTDISKYLNMNYFHEKPGENNGRSSSFVLPSEGIEDKKEMQLTKANSQIMKSAVDRLRKQRSVTTFIPEIIQEDSGFVYDYVLHQDEVVRMKKLRGKVIIQNYFGTNSMQKV